MVLYSVSTISHYQLSSIIKVDSHVQLHVQLYISCRTIDLPLVIRPLVMAALGT
jgi:hypothetical protein